MSATFWGLVILAFAVVQAAVQVRRGLSAIAKAFEARNSLLSLIGQRGERAGLHRQPRTDGR